MGTNECRIRILKMLNFYFVKRPCYEFERMPWQVSTRDVTRFKSIMRTSDPIREKYIYSMKILIRITILTVKNVCFVPTLIELGTDKLSVLDIVGIRLFLCYTKKILIQFLFESSLCYIIIYTSHIRDVYYMKVHQIIMLILITFMQLTVKTIISHHFTMILLKL